MKLLLTRGFGDREVKAAKYFLPEARRPHVEQGIEGEVPCSGFFFLTTDR